ncbi:hypothetical protein LCGC14_1382080, partial [marine sediment metagenome]
KRKYVDYLHDYTTSIAYIKPKRHLEILVNNFYCRDELIPAIVANIKAFKEANKLVKTVSANDRTLRFEMTDLRDDYNKPCDQDEVSRYGELLRIALMGETNEDFSFAASPYLVRYAVQRIRDWGGLPAAKKERILNLDGHSTLREIRVAMGWRDWFWDLMIKADYHGVRLNANMKEAWLLDTNCDFGHMGLDLLKLQSQPRIGDKRDFESWFPPIALRKV